MTRDEQEVVTALNDLVEPVENATLREHCGDQGVWRPSDLELKYLAGEEASTFMRGPKTGYEPQLVVSTLSISTPTHSSPSILATPLPIKESLIQDLTQTSEERSPLGWWGGAMWVRTGWGVGSSPASSRHRIWRHGCTTPTPEAGSTSEVWRMSRWRRGGPRKSCTTGA